MRSPQNNWDFWTGVPEALPNFNVSDRGMPKDFRHARLRFTYVFYNDEGERVWVKYHFRTQQGIIQMMKREIVSQDRESSQRDLYDAIENGDYPKWKMYIQVMTEEQAKIIQIIHLI